MSLLHRASILSATCLPFLWSCETATEPSFIDTGFDLADAIGEDDAIDQFNFTSDGTLWILTARGAVLEVHEGGAVVHDPSPGGSGPGVGLDETVAVDLFIDGEDRIWVASLDQYSVFADATWDVHRTAGGQPFRFPVFEIAVNGRGDVLVGAGNTEGGGFWLERDHAWTHYTRQSAGLPTSMINEIEVGPNDEFWASSGQWQGRGGLSRISGTELEVVLSGREAGLLYAAPDGIGECETCVSGVGRVDPSGAIEMLSMEAHGLSEFEYLPWIEQAPSGDVFVATAHRLLRIAH